MQHLRSITWIHLSLLLMLTYPSLSFSGDQDQQRVSSALKNLETKNGEKISATWDQDKRKIRTLRGKLSTPYSGTPEQAGMRFLAENPDLFQLDPSLSDLTVENTRQPGGGEALTTIVRLKQTVSGLPVFGGGLEIYVKKDGSINQVNNYYIPGLVIDPHPSLTPEQAGELAKTNFTETCTHKIDKKGTLQSCQGQPLVLNREPEPQLGVYETAGRPHLAYQFVLDVSSPLALIEFTIDANTGEILRKIDLIQNFTGYSTGSGKVFDPNPTNSLFQYGIVPQDNSNNNVFTNAYVIGTLNQLESQVIGRKTYYYLIGPYVDVSDALEPPYNFSTTSGYISSTNLTFNFNRSNNAFEHVMVYYHIDTNQRYIQSLGPEFTNINSRPIQVDPHGLSGADQSHYNPNPLGAGYLAFGDGGVDDAEDADVILHEYGHAIQDSQMPGKYLTGCDTEAGAMGEGFGDYWAASNTNDASLSNGFDPACWAEWDASPSGNPCERRTDSPKHYNQQDLTHECHADGEIWSSLLWSIMMGGAGKTATDKIVLRSHTLVPDNPTFIDGVEALLAADTQLYGDQPTYNHHTHICNQARTREIFADGCEWEPWGIGLNDYHTWNSYTDLYRQTIELTPVELTPGNYFLTLDTRQIPNDHPHDHLILQNFMGDIPDNLTKLVIRLKSHGFYNSYPDNICREWGFIRFLYETGDYNVLVTNSNCLTDQYIAPFYRVDYRIIGTDQWDTYEIPLPTPTHLPFLLLMLGDERSEYGGAFSQAYYVMDIDFIDFRSN